MRFESLINPESRLADVRALLDSYAIRLGPSDRPFLQLPIHSVMCGLGIGRQREEEPETQRFELVDEFPAVSLVRFEPSPDIRERCTRWPFFVESPLIIEVCVGKTVHSFHFVPGPRYTNREQADRTE